MTEEKCQWKRDKSGEYTTDCGEITYRRPYDYVPRLGRRCPYCGRKIEDVNL